MTAFNFLKAKCKLFIQRIEEKINNISLYCKEIEIDCNHEGKYIFTIGINLPLINTSKLDFTINVGENFICKNNFSIEWKEICNEQCKITG